MVLGGEVLRAINRIEGCGTLGRITQALFPHDFLLLISTVPCVIYSLFLLLMVTDRPRGSAVSHRTHRNEPQHRSRTALAAVRVIRRSAALAEKERSDGKDQTRQHLRQEKVPSARAVESTGARSCQLSGCEEVGCQACRRCGVRRFRQR